MSQKTILIASVLISLFIIGGVIGFAQAKNNANADSLSPEMQVQLATREAAYNDLIAQANDQIQSLNEQVSAMQAGKDYVDGQPTISAEEAIQAARDSAAGDDYLQGIPELASFEGQTVYNVAFTSGQVYVDAFSGAVLYSSIPVKIDSQQAIQVAADYLQINDTSRATVQTVVLEGSEFYKVNLGSYVVYIDAYGSITKVQEIQYTATSSSSSSSSSSHESYEHEHEDEHDDDD
ncbi:MAG: hypothetical protein PWQ55_538 [Chloroflexota bacterium]|nr:hypothetical protein [Chloroflexota bacterium]